MKKAEWEAIHRRARMASRVLSGVLEDLEKTEPNWAALGSLEIVRGALYSLRHYLEDEKEPEINWKEPFVELHFPVEWNFEGEPYGPTYGAQTATLEDLESDEKTAEKVTEIFLQARNYELLRFFTKKATFYKSGNSYEGHLEEEDIEEIEKLPKDEQDTAFEKRFKPLAFFGEGENTPWDEDEGPAIVIRGEADNGEPYTGSVVLEFYPLVVERITDSSCRTRVNVR